MKTQEQLSKMTDQELTFELACLVFGAEDVVKLKKAIFIMSDMRKVDINDWSWIMLLVVEHKVNLNLLPSSEKYAAFDACDTVGCYAIDDSPQRAIAICLIMKLQEIQE